MKTLRDKAIDFYSAIGVSPSEDLIKADIELQEWLTNMTHEQLVNQIVLACNAEIWDVFGNRLGVRKVIGDRELIMSLDEDETHWIIGEYHAFDTDSEWSDCHESTIPAESRDVAALVQFFQSAEKAV